MNNTPLKNEPVKVGHIHVRTTLMRKGYWVLAARKEKKKLAQWMIDILDTASKYTAQ